MAKRGKVLRDPHLGPGLLVVEGKQYPFQMEELWRSEVPAKPGLIVNVDFDAQGNVIGITAVPQSELDQERAEPVGDRLGARQRFFKRWVPANNILARLVAIGILIVAWFVLTAVSVHVPLLGKLDLTFWQVLGYLSSGSALQFPELPGNPDSGVFGFLAILVLAGPFLPYVWKDRRSSLGGVLPLAFMVFVAFRFVVGVNGLFVIQGPGLHEPLETNLRDAIIHELRVGLGTYLSASVAIYFAVLSVKRLLESSRLREEPRGWSQKVAA